MTVCTWLFFAAVSVTGIAHPELTKVITFWVLAVALIALARACARAWCRSRITYIQNTIIVGAGDVGQSVARKLLRHSEYGINVVGFVRLKVIDRRNPTTDCVVIDNAVGFHAIDYLKHALHV